MDECRRFEANVVGQPVDARLGHAHDFGMNRPAHRDTIADGHARDALADRLDNARRTVTTLPWPCDLSVRRGRVDARAVVRHARQVRPLRAA